jgi:ubiquinone/menaquinone biosynthesis C-methylase UbiE
MESIDNPQTPRAETNRSLYGKEYGEVQGRGVAAEYLKILYDKLTGNEGRVIELGVGSGSLIPFLENKFGKKNVIGLEIGWILRNSPLNKDKNNIEGDIESLPIASNSVDRVVSLHTFEHAPDLQLALEEVERILTPGGEAILVVPRPQFKLRQLGALVDTLRMYAGFEKLKESWVKAEGNKVFSIWNQLKLAWDKAGEYHVQNVTPKKIEEAGTNLRIMEAQSVFVPWEMGSSWVITLKKIDENEMVKS